MKISMNITKIVLSIFIVGFSLAFLTSLFSLYPEDMANNFIIKIGLNSITSIGFLLNLIYFWLNPHLSIDSREKDSGNKKIYVSSLGTILVVAGVLYGLIEN